MDDLSIYVHLKELEELGRKFPEAAQAATEAVLWDCLTRLEAEVVERTPVGVGGAAGLRGSIGAEIAGGREGPVGRLGTPLEYGKPVELGRKPGKWPPRGPIELWVRRKLNITDPEQAAAVAFLVQQKIGEKGFKGAHMFREGLRAADSYIFDRLQSIPEGIVERITR